MEIWSASCCTDVTVDSSIFDAWLNGNVVEDDGIKEATGDLFDHHVVLSEIDEQINLYRFLKAFLEQPRHFSRLQYQIDSRTRDELIAAYYYFNPAFAREALNRRISSKLRKEIEDVSEKLNIPHIACLRFLDNFRLVIGRMEDCEKGDLTSNIKFYFLMKDDLAKAYASVVFVTLYKIDLSKRRIQFLNFSDVNFCTSNIMTHWSRSITDDGGDFLDRDFLSRLQELKSFDSESVTSISEIIQKKFDDDSVDKDVLKNLLKEIVFGGVHAKDIKEFFLNILRVIDVATTVKPRTFASVVNAVTELSWSEVWCPRASKEMARVTARDWGRFIECYRPCLIRVHSRAYETSGQASAMASR